METEDPEDVQARFVVPNQDSGSDYEESDAEASASLDEQEEEPRFARPFEPNLDASLSRSQSRGRKTRGTGSDEHAFKVDNSKSRASSTESQREERLAASSGRAATFQPPQSPPDAKAWPKSEFTRKRRMVKTPSQTRAKRLKSWYNSDYRELLNVEIRDSVARNIADHREPLESSQIGCSIWTSEEKDLFFSALSRLGRDDIQGIAARVCTKSEIEVHEYIQLLHEGLLSTSQKNLDYVDNLPAAVDISEECCGILERAGDALAIRQESAEEEVELAKWDNLWLFNSNTNDLLHIKSDRKEVKETLPSVNLFNLGNWLDLSHRVFMNSNRVENNWESVAELNETPAIRATAFEDFHSLVVSVTKRLVSATLFCTMSRQRARGSVIVKQADVNDDDVEAAVKILGLKTNSRDFWMGCARRCNLRIFDEEWNSFMSYDEVEKSLCETRERSRSRSVSRRGRSMSHTQSEIFQESQLDTESPSEDYDSDEDFRSPTSRGSISSDADATDSLSADEGRSSEFREARLQQRAQAKQYAQQAHLNYIEAFDNDQSQLEEQRLWNLLKQTAPFGELKSEPIGLADIPQGNFRDDMDQSKWRNHLEFRSQWETLETPVLEAMFDRNRKRVSESSRRRLQGARADPVGPMNEEDDSAAEASDDEDGINAPYIRIASEEMDDESEDHFSDEELLDDAPKGSDDDETESAQGTADLEEAPQHTQSNSISRIGFSSDVSHSPIGEDIALKREYDSSD